MVYLTIEITWKGNTSEETVEAIMHENEIDKDALFELLRESSCTKIKIGISEG
jgi:hypothetical protein